MPAPPPPTPPLRTLLVRGAARRCPVCGASDVFASWFTIRDRCPCCRLRFERIEGHWLGSLGLNTIVSFTALFGVLLVGVVATWPDLPVVPLTAAALATAVIVPLVFFPWSRTLWTAIDLAMRPLESGEARPPTSREEGPFRS